MKGIKFIETVLDLGFSGDRKRLHKDIDLMFDRNKVEPLFDADEYEFIEDEAEREKRFEQDKAINAEQEKAKDEIHALISEEADAEIIVEKINTFCDLIEKHNDRDIEGIMDDEKYLFKDVYGLELWRAEAIKDGIETVKELRSLTGMTRQSFADFFKIPYRTVENWERGDRECPEYLFELMIYKLKNENMI